jgi:hypothetical protein
MISKTLLFPKLGQEIGGKLRLHNWKAGHCLSSCEKLKCCVEVKVLLDNNMI